MAPVEHLWHRRYESEGEFKGTASNGIYQCEDDDPPSRREPNVKALCNLNCKLDELSFDSLEPYYPPSGKALRTWGYKIRMVPSGASTEFSLHYEGRKLGSQTARIDFQDGVTV